MNLFPRRIQRRRAAGWRLPEGVICVSRGTRFGNPFMAGGPNLGYGQILGKLPRPTIYPAPTMWTVPDVIALYRAWLIGAPLPWPHRFIPDGLHGVEINAVLGPPPAAEEIAGLRGHDLACWCPPGPCHADVLIELANR